MNETCHESEKGDNFCTLCLQRMAGVFCLNAIMRLPLYPISLAQGTFPSSLAAFLLPQKSLFV